MTLTMRQFTRVESLINELHEEITRNAQGDDGADVRRRRHAAHARLRKLLGRFAQRRKQLRHVFVLTSTDPHRDDVVSVHRSLPAALKRAGLHIKDDKRSRPSHAWQELELSSDDLDAGRLFSAKVLNVDDGYSIDIHRIEVQP